MNWVLLIVAGFFEVGFATCLGKAKDTFGMASTLWMVGFFIALSISMTYCTKRLKPCHLVRLMQSGQRLE